MVKVMSFVDVFGKSVLDLMLETYENKMSASERGRLRDRIETSLKNLDKGKSGNLSTDDTFKIIHRSNGIAISREEFNKMIEPLNIDSDNMIKIKDFCRKPHFTKTIFDGLDRNKDGTLSRAELKYGSKDTISMAQIEQAISSMDKDKDGRLSFDEIQKIIEGQQKEVYVHQ